MKSDTVSELARISRISATRRAAIRRPVVKNHPRHQRALPVSSRDLRLLCERLVYALRYASKGTIELGTETGQAILARLEGDLPPEENGHDDGAEWRGAGV